MCFDRPSYLKKDSDSLGRRQFLFYYGVQGEWNGWMVSPHFCMYQQPLLRVDDIAQRPELVTNTWQERKDSVSEYEPNIQVKVNCQGTAHPCVHTKHQYF